MKQILPSNKLKFFQCSNAACKKIFLINPQKVKYGNGIHLCPTCFAKSKTHHKIECSNCQSIIDFLSTDEGEAIVTYYSKKCTCCNGTVDDEVHISENNFAEVFAKS
jgi:hypothetical protein